MLVAGLARVESEPRRRVGEQWFHRQLGGADERRIFSEHGGHDPDQLARRGQRAAIELGLDRPDDVRRQPHESPAEHDEPRVEDVDQAGQADAQPAPDVVDGGQRGRLVGSGSR